MEPAGGHPTHSERTSPAAERPAEIEKITHVANEQLLDQMRNTIRNLAAQHPILVPIVNKFETEGVLKTFGAVMTAVHLAANCVGRDEAAQGTGESLLQWECEHAEALANQLIRWDVERENTALRIVSSQNYLKILKFVKLFMTDPQFDAFGNQVVRFLIQTRGMETALKTVYFLKGKPVTLENYEESIQLMASFLLARRTTIIDAPEPVLSDEDFRKFAFWIAEKLAEQGHLELIPDVMSLTQVNVHLSPLVIDKAINQDRFNIIWEMAADAKEDVAKRFAEKATPQQVLALIKSLDVKKDQKIIAWIIRNISSPSMRYYSIATYLAGLREQEIASQLLFTMVRRFVASSHVSEAAQIASRIPSVATRDEALKFAIEAIMRWQGHLHRQTALHYLKAISDHEMAEDLKYTLGLE